MSTSRVKIMALAAIFAAGALVAGAPASTATPIASGLKTTGLPGIAADTNQVTKVRHRRRGYRGRRHGRRWHRRRHRHGRRHRYGPNIYFGLGAPFYYGYPYYGYYEPYNYGYYAPRRRYRRYRGGSCSRWHRRCVRNWGYGGADYGGCMRYHGCRPR